MEQWEEGEVLSVSRLSADVRHFRIRYSRSRSFLPGQFVMLRLPIESEFNTRSYSIASAPNEEGWIELCIVLKEDGAGTPFLFSQVQAGSLLLLSEPLGKFVLDRDHLSGKVMICTGTGVAPFRSMIRHLVGSGKLSYPVYLYFGNRHERDILYREEWEELRSQDPNFHFIPVLSREELWSGARGYVHEHYLPLATAHPDYQYYLCGWSDMVREAKNNLKALGLPRKLIKFELYD